MHLALRGSLVDATDMPGFVASDRAGLLQYRQLDGAALELLTLASLQPRQGIGRRLVAALAKYAAVSKIKNIVVVTTNDNLAALAFYQRLGFRLHALRQPAIYHARAQ